MSHLQESYGNMQIALISDVQKPNSLICLDQALQPTKATSFTITKPEFALCHCCQLATTQAKTEGRIYEYTEAFLRIRNASAHLLLEPEDCSTGIENDKSFNVCLDDDAHHEEFLQQTAWFEQYHYSAHPHCREGASQTFVHTGKAITTCNQQTKCITVATHVQTE